MTEIAHSIDLDIQQKLKDQNYRRAFFWAQASAEIADQLVSLRKRRDLNQKQVAEMIGTKQPAISRAEQADYQNWNLNTLRIIAEALDARIRVVIEPSEDVIAEYDFIGKELQTDVPIDIGKSVSEINLEPSPIYQYVTFPFDAGAKQASIYPIAFNGHAFSMDEATNFFAISPSFTYVHPKTEAAEALVLKQSLAEKDERIAALEAELANKQLLSLENLQEQQPTAAVGRAAPPRVPRNTALWERAI